MWTRQFLTFAGIGAVAFLVDGGVLFILMEGGVGPYLGRCVSWVVAVTLTWYMNRVRTFRGQGRQESALRQWGRFLVTNSAGGSLNLLVYAVAIGSSAWVREYPLLGVALGSITGLTANFLLSKRFVFHNG